MALTSPPPLLVVWASQALSHSLQDVKGPSFVQISCRWATAAVCPRWQHCTDSSPPAALPFSPSPLLECSLSPGEQLFLPCSAALRRLTAQPLGASVTTPESWCDFSSKRHKEQDEWQLRGSQEMGLVKIAIMRTIIIIMTAIIIIH